MRFEAPGTSQQVVIIQPTPPQIRRGMFDCGEFGTVTAIISGPSDRTGNWLPLGSTVELPNALWAGYDRGRSSCRVEGYVESFAWIDGLAPAFIIRTLEDSWCYPFSPATLAEHVKGAAAPPAASKPTKKRGRENEEDHAGAK